MQNNSQRNWVWNHFSKLDQSHTKCKYCIKIIHKYKCRYTKIMCMKAHLYNTHKIYDEKDLLKWNKDPHFLWQYFFKKDLFLAKCKICDDSFYNVYDKSSLGRHLIQWHPDIISFIQKEITRTWLSQHFTFDMKNHNTNCTHCDYTSKIYNGPNVLKSHLNISHNIKVESEFDGKTGYYNVDATAQQSITEENAISFYHVQAIENQQR